MGVLLYLNTDTSYMELENIQELKITQSFNEHGVLTLTALIQEEVKTKYATEINPYEMVEVVVGEKDNYKTIFKGIAKNIEIHQIKKIYYLFVTAVTGSYKMDLEIKSRSFQDKNMTYKKMLGMIIKEYTQGDMVDYLTDNEKINELVVQYRETDWEFLKRIASRFFGGIIPAIQYDVPKIVLGKPYGTNRGEIEKYNFYMNKDLERFLFSSKNGNEKLTQLDVITFFIETTEEFDIGDSLTYFDKASNLTYTNFYIKSKEIEMVEGILRFRYSLCSENGFMVDRIYNEKITGVSLKGEVLDRIGDSIKVKLEIDEKQDIDKAWQFSYTTPYTAGGYSGWYVMPEIGDTVLIYFPNKKEYRR